MESKAILGLIERLCVGGWQANELHFRIEIPPMQLLCKVRENVLKYEDSGLVSLSLSLTVHSST